MPYLNVKIGVAPSAELTRTVASSLTDLTADLLGKKKALTSVALEYIAPVTWFIGGAPVLDSRLSI